MIKKTLVTLMFLVFVLGESPAQNNGDISKLEQVINIISKSYMDTINTRKLVDETIRILFERLDPHTVYRSKDEAKDDFLNRPAFHRGIGMDFRIFDDTMTVTGVIPRSPAEKAGLRPGTRIAFANGKHVSGSHLKYPEITDYLSRVYHSGDSIRLGVIKDKKVKTVAIQPDQIQNNSIESFYAVNDSCIYLKISFFNFNTGKEFTEAVKTFTKKQLKNIILDLRDNPGGMLTACNEVCTHFFNEGIQIANMRSQSAEACKSLFAESGGLLTNSRICVLINELSASSSEIIAGAVQDWDRGIIIGRRSFGKGLVQQLFTLEDSSQIRITVSKIHTPSGRCIQKEYKTSGFNKYNGEIISRRLRGENTDKNKIPIAENTASFYTIKLHRKIYPDLGIIPDVFVPEDTVSVPAFWQSWYTNRAIDNFILSDINKNRESYSKEFPNFKKFTELFTPTRKLEREIFEYCQKDTSDCQKISREEFENFISPLYPADAEKAVLKQLKARYAYFLFGSTEWRKFLNLYDKDFNAALKLINDYEEYQNAFK